MTRRYQPHMIAVDHEATRQAEQYREAAKPVPTPRDPESPAAWEAKPEPPQAAQPKPGLGRGVRVVLPQPDGAVVMNPEDARIVKGMLSQALQVTTDPATKAKLRAAQAELNSKTRGAL